MNLLIAPDKQDLAERAETPGAHDVVIRLEQVSVVYRAPRERINTFKEYVIRLAKGGIKHDEFRALNEVTFDIRRGEVFGIIGHNGAGKSTLLKVVSRVLKPTEGRVWVKGRLAPMLELGAGFHPELTGRENVFLNGTLLGYSHAQMEELFDEIVEFAELQDFIDAPLRTYSTGMSVRLGFAVATATRPDVLVVDEVLSVGDEPFQAKCAARIADFRSEGTAILLVTHDSRLALQMCDRAVWLDHGAVRGLGDTLTVIAAYQQHYGKPGEFAEPLPLNAIKQLQTEEVGELEARVLEKSWYYPFVLPSDNAVDCQLDEGIQRIHTDRLHMIFQALRPVVHEQWNAISCLDIGCNQGYFAANLAARGCQKVVGLDLRPQNVADADLIRQVYGLQNLSFHVADINSHEAQEQYDVVMMLSLLIWLENPIGALRIARQLTRRVLLVETPVVPEVSGQIDWGTRHAQKTVFGSFGVLDIEQETLLSLGGRTDLALVPGRATLIWLLQRLGFSKVEVIAPPKDSYEQLATGKRILVAAYI
jgi:ABC-type polysaccharide/polyol phosphate transport system ATPase subunit/SAM-dependent methyltransferase